MLTRPQSCPRCGVNFDPQSHRSAEPVAAEIRRTLDEHRAGTHRYRSPEATIEAASLVACPACGFEFPSPNVRFLGLLSPRATRLLFIALAVAFTAIAAVTLITSLP